MARPDTHRRGARIGLYGISYSGKSRCLDLLENAANGAFLTVDSGDLLRRMAAPDGWATKTPAEKDALRAEALRGDCASCMSGLCATCCC